MSGQRWWPAYIGIGSNLESPRQQIAAGNLALGELDDCGYLQISPLYRSDPLGSMNQPDFVNGVVGLMTRLEPRALFEQLQAIEDSLGRDRSTERWGPRIIDLDLLAYGSLRVDEEDLQVPHPGITERNFVLLPWADIAPGFVVPGHRNVISLAKEAPAEPPIERLDEE
jgi:2-amino-4-hydroxy-6-hydroxymethyldihydropteridine diphosphokinase